MGSRSLRMTVFLFLCSEKYEKKKQILRLATPELHPADEDLRGTHSVGRGAPETGVRLGRRSLRMTIYFSGGGKKAGEAFPRSLTDLA